MLAHLAFAGLALVPTFASAAEFRACETDPAFVLDEMWPAAGATDVPIDGIVVLTGRAGSGGFPAVEVTRDGVMQTGEFERVGVDQYVWRGEPFAPNATYVASIFGTDAGEPITFTTGAELAPPPATPGPIGLALAQDEVTITECVQGDGVCCFESKVVDTQLRMSATITLPAPPAPFGTVDLARVEVAPDPESFGDELRSEQPWASPVYIDLGEAGTWPSDQVCARLTVIDPLEKTAEGEVVCAPIGAVNEVPGCGCATSGERAPLLLLGLLPLLRRRVRRSRR